MLRKRVTPADWEPICNEFQQIALNHAAGDDNDTGKVAVMHALLEVAACTVYAQGPAWLTWFHQALEARVRQLALQFESAGEA